MSQPLLRNFGMNPRAQQLRRVTVPEVVEANFRKVLDAADEARELVRQTAGLSRPTISTRAQKRFPVLPNTKGQQFLRLMTFQSASRQRGGVSSSAGVGAIGHFQMYVLGFQTGYNLAADGVYNVFGSLGEDAGISVLFTIEPWCAKHPEALFDDALFDLLKTLRENAKGN